MGTSVLYLHDNAHGDHGRPGFATGVGTVLDYLPGGTLYLEDLCTTTAEKEWKEGHYNRFVDGESDLLDPAEMRERFERGDLDRPDDLDDVSEWDEYAIAGDDGWMSVGREGSSRVDLLREIADRREAIDRIDVGPAHDDLTADQREMLYEIDRTPESDLRAADLDVLLSAFRVIEDDWVEHVREDVAAGRTDPENAAVVMGGAHRLDERLDRYVDVERVNAPDFPDKYASVTRRAAVRDALAAADVGYALFGDPADVADEVGLVEARTRLAGVGAALHDDAKFEDAGEWLERYERAVTRTNRGTEADRVERLQREARETLGEVVDLDAVREYDDVTVTPPDGEAGDRSPAAAVADRRLPGAVDESTVAAVGTLLGDDPVAPSRIAAVERLFAERGRDRSAESESDREGKRREMRRRFRDLAVERRDGDDREPRRPPPDGGSSWTDALSAAVGAVRAAGRDLLDRVRSAPTDDAVRRSELIAEVGAEGDAECRRAVERLTGSERVGPERARAVRVVAGVDEATDGDAGGESPDLVDVPARRLAERGADEPRRDDDPGERREL